MFNFNFKSRIYKHPDLLHFYPLGRLNLSTAMHLRLRRSNPTFRINKHPPTSRRIVAASSQTLEVTQARNHLTCLPVNFSYASLYFLDVSATTLSGIFTPSFPLSPDVVSQSRRYCYNFISILIYSEISGRVRTHLVITLLAPADLVLIGWPEARAVRSEDFIDEDDLVGRGVKAEFELRVGDDDTTLCGVVASLCKSFSISKPAISPDGSMSIDLRAHRSATKQPRSSSRHQPQRSQPRALG